MRFTILFTNIIKENVCKSWRIRKLQDFAINYELYVLYGMVI